MQGRKSVAGVYELLAILFNEMYRRHGAATEQTICRRQGKAEGIALLDFASNSCLVELVGLLHTSECLARGVQSLRMVLGSYRNAWFLTRL